MRALKNCKWIVELSQFDNEWWWNAYPENNKGFVWNDDVSSIKGMIRRGDCINNWLRFANVNEIKKFKIQKKDFDKLITIKGDYNVTKII